MEVTPVVKTIQDEMTRRGWSVQKLGDEAGVPFQVIYRAFNGQASPNVETVNKLLAALGLKLAVVR